MDNNVVYDRIDELMVKAEEIKSSLADVQADVIEFGGMLENVQAFTNETNIVVKDILNGRQLSEWIADLAASGKSSATYADSSRMQALAEDTDACKNVQVSQYIFDWCVTNNKVGTYYNSIFGSVSGVTWSSLTTPAQVCANATAFAKVASYSTTVNTSWGNEAFKEAIFYGFSITETIMKNAGTYNHLFGAAKEIGSGSLDEISVTGKLILRGYRSTSAVSSAINVTITRPDDSVKVFRINKTNESNLLWFAKKITRNNTNGWGYASYVEL